MGLVVVQVVADKFCKSRNFRYKCDLKSDPILFFKLNWFRLKLETSRIEIVIGFKRIRIIF